MNCHETRERLSDLLDEALAAPERAEVGAHLAGCADCRRELDRLRATVSLLSRVERPRAPVGFADRVTARARPVPWYHRLGRWLFLPLNIKLPAQVAAMLVIALLGVYLLQRTPELRDAARLEPGSPAFRSEPSGAIPAASIPPPAQRQKDLKAGKVDSGNVSAPAPRAARETESTVRDQRRLDSPPTAPPSTQALKLEVKKEAEADRLREEGAPASQAAPAPRVAKSIPPSPAVPRAEVRAKRRDTAEGQSGAIAPAPPAMAAKRQSTVSSVLGRLNVKSRPAAEQGLADLLARLGGNETGRRQEMGATVVEVLVPETRYADFLSGLATLGAFTPENQPVALPTEPQQFRLSIRITE
jgi:Putative zinc-finger